MPSILFVDDEEFVLTALQRHFLDEDYTILTANSGREALAILENQPVQVVVSDFRMPEMNGGELLRQVSHQWPETVRIVLSGYADISAVISAINDGAIYKFVTKPWQEHELKAAIVEALEKQRSLVQMRKLAEQALAEASQLLDTDKVLADEDMDSKIALMDQENRKLRLYRGVFHAIPLAILFFDSTGELSDATDSVQKLFCGSAQGGIEFIPEDLTSDVKHVLAGKTIPERGYCYCSSNPVEWPTRLIPISDARSPRGVVAVISQ
jgi:two-component system NtrC family sensor kinase